MNFTFKEWKMIAQAVEVWRGDCEKHLKECKPSDEKYSNYQIFLRQIVALKALEDKIENSVI